VLRDAEKVEQEFKQKILDEMKTLETSGAQEMSSLRYFYSSDSSLGGVIGGIATNYLFDETKPLFSLAKKINELHISCRGNQLLVKKGLDLGFAMKTVAEELDGHGGGHKIASGATIALEKEKQFLERSNELIAAQLQGGL
jgi:RecJ-like exonuclease